MNTSQSENVNSEDNTNEVPICYRIRQFVLLLSIVCTIALLTFDVGSVYVSYWNIDGSFDNPKLTALFCGVFWSCFVLMSIYCIVAYFLERLFVKSDAITLHTCFGKQTINISDVIQIDWKRYLSGIIIVRGHHSRIKIYLSNYTADDQSQLIAYFRTTFSPDIQKDYSVFTETRLPHKPRNPDEKFRSIAILCALLLFIFASFFVYFWVADYGVQWLMVGVISALAGLWYLWRIFNFQDQTPNHKL